MSVAIKKLDGVASVEVSLDKANADIRFNADNKITLPQLRQIIKKNGYPTRDAQIVARGRVVDRNGTPTLDLLNGSSLRLAAKPQSAPDTVVEVTGVSRVYEKEEQLTVTTVK